MFTPKVVLIIGTICAVIGLVLLALARPAGGDPTCDRGSCLIPPLVIERPESEPVPAVPTFTG